MGLCWAKTDRVHYLHSHTSACMGKPIASIKVPANSQWLQGPASHSSAGAESELLVVGEDCELGCDRGQTPARRNWVQYVLTYEGGEKQLVSEVEAEKPDLSPAEHGDLKKPDQSESARGGGEPEKTHARARWGLAMHCPSEFTNPSTTAAFKEQGGISEGYCFKTPGPFSELYVMTVVLLTMTLAMCLAGWPPLLMQSQMSLKQQVKVNMREFGWMGHLVTRTPFNSRKVDTVGIDDPLTGVNYMVYMLKYDSTHGKFNGTGKAEERKSHLRKFHLPGTRSWCQICCGPTGIFAALGKAGAHLKVGAMRVMISAPSVHTPTFVMGMRSTTSSRLSATSPAPGSPAEDIRDNLGIMEGLVTTVPTISVSQKVVGGPGAAQNIIPLLLVPPRLWASYQIQGRQESGAAGPLKDIPRDAAEAQVASCNHSSDAHSCTFNAQTGTALSDHSVELISWYENEFSHSNRVVDIMVSMCSKE
ncbi:Glyceraldehyde-3-phosphate dehydrogenase [Galemys pyrenaicus]|uniref:Glyceraldehyde-3-phosphate dehydrogenase n=1 Tax=Galemys pyrenaicus TaxID=202257 RepID=A0A8J6A3U9_GALPY|nr:Glyceraldehyde-3-phosphate dehydrogenase [Galemys pyrenaicus]